MDINFFVNVAFEKNGPVISQINFAWFRKSKAILDLEVTFSQEEQTTTDEPLEATAARDKDAQLYIDYEGKLHRISELQKVNYFMSSLLEKVFPIYAKTINSKLCLFCEY